MRRAARGLVVLVGLSLSPLVIPTAADARRVIGDPKKGDDKKDDKDEKSDEKKDPKKDDKKPDTRSEAEKKKDAEAKAAADKAAKEAEAARKQAEREAAEAEVERQEREREMAEEAAERAAKAAKEKAAEEKRKAEEEKRRKVEERKAANRAARLRTAKKQRTLTRISEPTVVVAKLTPGGPEVSKVLEVRFDVAEKLKVASARFGSSKPVKGLALIATVAGPEGETRYRVHALRSAGAYAFHLTPSGAGEYAVSLTGGGVDVTFPVHVGVWPPPDFEAEEERNASVAFEGTGRRILK